MKFTYEQIEKVRALRAELVGKVTAFGLGVKYGMNIEENTSTAIYPTWTAELSNNVNELEIEEELIGDTNISKLDEADFYVCLGMYFEKIYATAEKAEREIFPYFHSMICIYERKVMEALKN